MADFNYVPTYGMMKRTEPRVNLAQFGDGYEQRVGDGINTMLAKYECKFELDDSTLGTVIAFLELKAAVTAFTWIPPNESQITVVCRSWSVSREAYNYNILTVVFERVLA